MEWAIKNDAMEKLDELKKQLAEIKTKKKEIIRQESYDNARKLFELEKDIIKKIELYNRNNGLNE